MKSIGNGIDAPAGNHLATKGRNKVYKENKVALFSNCMFKGTHGHLGLGSVLRINLWLPVALRSPARNWDLDLGLFESRLPIKSLALGWDARRIHQAKTLHGSSSKTT